MSLTATLAGTKDWEFLQETQTNQELHKDWWTHETPIPLLPEIKSIIQIACQDLGIVEGSFLSEDEFIHLLQTLESLPLIRRSFTRFEDYPNRRLPIILVKHLLVQFTVIPKRNWLPDAMADTMVPWVHDTVHGCVVLAMAIQYRQSLIQRIALRNTSNNDLPIDILRITPQLIAQCRRRRLHTESLLIFLPRGVVAIMSAYAWLFT